MEALAIIAMVTGFLLQNLAEWRGGGPILPYKTAFGISLQPETDTSRALALILVSLLVAALCAVSISSETGWLAVCIAAALVANAALQLGFSIRAKRALPGTFAGLFFMMPPSLWVLVVVDNGFGLLPVLLGPVASGPVLVSVWWLSNAVVRRMLNR